MAKTHVSRARAASAVLVTLFAGAAILISWRVTPARYRSVAVIDATAPAPASTGGSDLQLPDPVQIALAPGTRRATLIASHLPPDDSDIEFRATSPARNKVSLAVTASGSSDSAMVVRHWRAVLAALRHQEVTYAIRAASRALKARVTELHESLQRVDAQLVKLMPVLYHGLLRYDAPNGNVRRGGRNAPPTVPERGTPRELDLAFERVQLLASLNEVGRLTAVCRCQFGSPPVITKLLIWQPPKDVDRVPPEAVPALALWLAALGVVLGAPLVVHRLRTRSWRRTRAA